jgi:hypothetical protein
MGGNKKERQEGGKCEHGETPEGIPGEPAALLYNHDQSTDWCWVLGGHQVIWPIGV